MSWWLFCSPFCGSVYLFQGADLPCTTTANSRHFSGDPNFPSKLSVKLTDRGEKIRFYEDLYRQYSRLDFTRITDRSIAILGLEQRMVRDFRAWGGYGIFDDKPSSLFPRSLLWRRTNPEEN